MSLRRQASKLTPVSLTGSVPTERLSQRGRIFAEYIWLDHYSSVRCKTMVLNQIPASPADLPEWNYDGSSTGQAPGGDSEVLIRARAIYPDPFRGGDNILVMCDTWLPNGKPHPDNMRVHAEKVFEECKEQAPWYGFEQEYTMFSADKWPLGWPKGGFPGPQGPYYCSVGADTAFGRKIVEAHAKACLHANITLSGINAEVMPGQWEYQVGPVEGIAAADQLWVSRYLLKRVSEEFGVTVSFDPKPIPGDWNGAGMHTNYSTEDTRKEGGIAAINKYIENLGLKHKEHIKAYGEGNERRLTGLHETASIHDFSSGVANRGASIRIPRTTDAKKCGYLEDRRPSSNVDPYVCSAIIAKTTMGLKAGEELYQF